MIFFLILFFAIVLWQFKFCRLSFYEDCLSKEKTNAIKGIFILIVFVNHIREYYAGAGTDLSLWYDNVLFLLPKAFGQLMVVMFLFYSGYGVMESIKAKGEKYVNVMPKRRVLTTLINFDIAVVIFALVGLTTGMNDILPHLGLSLIGWDSVGNSNWYIFCILVCYFLTYVTYKYTKSGGVLCTLTIVFAMIMSLYKGTWWYNTVAAYCVGVLFSSNKKIIMEAWKSGYVKWLLTMAGGFTFFLGIYLYWYAPFKGEYERLGAIVFNMMSIFFALLVVMLTMKVSIDNMALRWLGRNLFPLYIYQRLPMMVLATLYGDILIVNHPIFYFLICLSVTCLITMCYRFIQVSIK